VSFALRPSSVRLRLALWYGAAVAAVLLIYAVGVYLFVRNSLREELDRGLHDDFEIVEQLLDTKTGNTAEWLRAAVHHEDGAQPMKWMEVWSPVGNLQYRPAGMELLPDPARVPAGYEYRSAVTPAGARMRILTAAHTVGPAQYLIRVTRSEEQVRRELRELLVGFGLGFPIAIVCAGIGGYHLARRALRPVERMAAQAQSITADQLRVRLPVDNAADELGHLATVFNALLARIEEAFDRLKRFTADASHELRTPLTAIRSVGEVGLREPRDVTAYREVIGSMLEEADRLTRLVDSLLFLSRADSGHTPVTRESVQLADLAREVAGHLWVLAEERSQTVIVEAEVPTEAQVDLVLLREALVNVVDNAIKYSQAGAEIHIRVLSKAQGGPAIEVIDAGPGIAPEHQARIFDRFYRVDEGRSRDRGGSGLGLAIARWAVEANGGRIEVESERARGSVFRIVL
jgi:heavy metal sensor kinase